MIPEEEIRRLCLDIYRLTGKKVDMDDPIIIAALFFSSLMTEKRAELEAMSKKEQTDLPRLLDEAFRRNQKALEHTIPGIRQRLDQYVERLIMKIRGSVSDQEDKQGFRLNWVWLLSLGLACFLLGAHLGDRLGIGENGRYITVGKEMVRVLPKLDSGTREKIERAIRG